MSPLQPVVQRAPVALRSRRPGAPPACRENVWERSRFEWRTGMPGDPFALLTEFLANQGITLREVGFSRSVTPDLCGAAVLLGASLAPGSRPSPASAVPDLVCVVYEHQSVSGVSSPRPAARFELGDWRPSWSNDRH